ncbi:MAG: hypothetical protein ACI4JF_09860 [Oscillospiraceae bacterium]
MSLYGINAYMSNTLYTSLLSGQNSYGANSKKTNTNNTSDLLALMKRADEVRSVSYRKSMTEEYRKIFSGEDIGSAENEVKLSDTAKSLSVSASALATGSTADFSDRESLTEKMETFIEDYNGTIDAMQKSNSVDALKNGLYMTNTAKAYARTLSIAGITLGSDNKLTLDKEKFASAYDSTIKSLFNGSYSFASKVADKASDISRSAALKAQVTYNSQGNLDYFTKLSLNMFSEKI